MHKFKDELEQVVLSAIRLNEAWQALQDVEREAVNKEYAKTELIDFDEIMWKLLEFRNNIQ